MRKLLARNRVGKGIREGMRGIESKKEGIGCKMRNSERIREEWRGNGGKRET